MIIEEKGQKRTDTDPHLTADSSLPLLHVTERREGVGHGLDER